MRAARRREERSVDRRMVNSINFPSGELPCRCPPNCACCDFNVYNCERLEAELIAFIYVAN